jgi:PAS domain S-box-containing protein
MQPVPAGQLRFRVFGGADGLRNLVITSVAQDRDGFLWIATEDGVYRFDGERFTHFSVDDGLTSTLTIVVGVAPDGSLCAGGPDGLACWDGTKFSRAQVRGLPALPVLTMATYGGKLWVGTDGGGLWVQDGGGGFVPARGWPGAGTTPVRALWSDAAGLVVGNGATVELTTGDGVWRDVGDIGLGHDRVEGVLRDRQGTLWIRTPSHMWLLAAGVSRASDLHAGLPTGYDATGAPSAMAIGPRGDVLIATDDGITYRERDQWRTIDHSLGMPTATVRTLFVDREGTIWAGAAGLFQLRGRGLIEHANVASGLPGEIVWTYARDRHGHLLAGTNRCLARAADGRWACVPGTENRVVRSVVFPPQGGMFLGGAPSDLRYIDDAGRATSLGDPDRPDHNILALALGPEGDLWIGTKAGLLRLRGAVPGPLEAVPLPGAPPNTRVASLVVVGDQLWAATAPGGVYVLDPHAGGEWRGFAVAEGFLTRSMSYLLSRADGRLCVAYTEAVGLTCFRYDGHGVAALAHLGAAQGLTTGMVYFLGEDRAHRLWIGTGDGVDVVTTDGHGARDATPAIDHFDESDGLAGNDSAAKAFLLDGDGSLWLGATGGATHVFAQDYAGPPAAPRIAFLAGRVGDRSIHDAVAGLEVPHDRGGLMVELAASSLLDPKRIEYQVRLSPLESEWSTTHQRQARYPALLAGSYRFEARARVDAGRWGPASELRFAVRPAWWQRGWWFALVAIGGVTAIGGGFGWRQRTVLRRRTRLLHAQTDASFRTVVDLMPDMISVHRDRKLIYLNRASRRMIGDSTETGVLRDSIHPDDRAHVDALFLRVHELEPDRVSEVIELRMRALDGSWRSCEVSAVRVEIGGAATVVGSGRDITERKRLRAQLMVSDRMASLGTLAAGIAHEINNPLAYVTGNLEAMAEAIQARGAGPADRAELSLAITEARDGAERVRKIVHGLRAFSRSEEERRVALALPGVLEAAIRMTGNEVRHRAELVRELGPTPLVIADDGRLTQVFINLLINAAHAIPEGHSDANRITVRTRTDAAGRAVVEIEDTGRGIAPDQLSRVFDPFFTTKEVGEGTGLGLSICHGIVVGLGGQISIDSAPGRGTIVRVVLPPLLAAEPPAPVPISAPVPPPTLTRRPRVMLVDDEPMVAQTIERLLRRDYDITIASCGRDALAHVVGGTRFDAIVSDVMMPNMTGIELLEELRRCAPDQAARVIFLSGGAFTAQTRERLELLGAPQLEKPITANELRACVLRIATEGSADGEPRAPARRETLATG